MLRISLTACRSRDGWRLVFDAFTATGPDDVGR